MNCEDKLKKIMGACATVLKENNVDDEDTWRDVKYACFMDEEWAWETLKKVFIEEEEK